MASAALTVRLARHVRMWPWLLAMVAVVLLGWQIFVGIALCEVAFRTPDATRVHPSLARAQETAHAADASVRSAALRAFDGAELHAWLYEPVRGNGATVLLLHGMGDSRAGAMGYVPMFLKHGYAVLSPDIRAHGDSGGEIATYGALESRDVRSWVDWLYAHHRAARLYGLGESMGGSILLQALALEPRFHAVATESAFSSLREIAYDRLSQHFHTRLAFGPALYWAAMDSASVYARARYGVDLDSVSAARAVAASATPVLLIHGQADDNVVGEHSYQIAAANPAHVVLWRPERAGHAAALGTCPELFEKRVIAWFDQHR